MPELIDRNKISLKVLTEQEEADRQLRMQEIQDASQSNREKTKDAEDLESFNELLKQKAPEKLGNILLAEVNKWTLEIPDSEMLELVKLTENEEIDGKAVKPGKVKVLAEAVKNKAKEIFGTDLSPMAIFKTLKEQAKTREKMGVRSQFTEGFLGKEKNQKTVTIGDQRKALHEYIDKIVPDKAKATEIKNKLDEEIKNEAKNLGVEKKYFARIKEAKIEEYNTQISSLNNQILVLNKEVLELQYSTAGNSPSISEQIQEKTAKIENLTTKVTALEKKRDNFTGKLNKEGEREIRQTKEMPKAIFQSNLEIRAVEDEKAKKNIERAAKMILNWGIKFGVTAISAPLSPIIAITQSIHGGIEGLKDSEAQAVIEHKLDILDEIYNKELPKINLEIQEKLENLAESLKNGEISRKSYFKINRKLTQILMADWIDINTAERVLAVKQALKLPPKITSENSHENIAEAITDEITEQNILELNEAFGKAVDIANKLLPKTETENLTQEAKKRDQEKEIELPGGLKMKAQNMRFAGVAAGVAMSTITATIAGLGVWNETMEKAVGMGTPVKEVQKAAEHTGFNIGNLFNDFGEKLSGEYGAEHTTFYQAITTNRNDVRKGIADYLDANGVPLSLRQKMTEEIRQILIDKKVLTEGSLPGLMNRFNSRALYNSENFKAILTSVGESANNHKLSRLSQGIQNFLHGIIPEAANSSQIAEIAKYGHDKTREIFLNSLVMTGLTASTGFLTNLLLDKNKKSGLSKNIESKILKFIGYSGIPIGAGLLTGGVGFAVTSGAVTAGVVSNQIIKNAPKALGFAGNVLAAGKNKLFEHQQNQEQNEVVDKEAIKELFGGEGITDSNFNQDSLENCYYLAILKGMFNNDGAVKILEKSIKMTTVDGEKRFTFTFPNGEKITKTEAEIVKWRAGSGVNSDNLGVAFLERAFYSMFREKVLEKAKNFTSSLSTASTENKAKVKAILDRIDASISKNPANSNDTMFWIDEIQPLLNIMGENVSEEIYKEMLGGGFEFEKPWRIKPSRTEKNPGPEKTAVEFKVKMTELAGKLQENKAFIVMNSDYMKNLKSSEIWEKLKFTSEYNPEYANAGHAFTLLSIDTNTETVVLSNPHQSKEKIPLSFEEARTYFREILVTNIPPVKVEAQVQKPNSANRQPHLTQNNVGRAPQNKENQAQKPNIFQKLRDFISSNQANEVVEPGLVPDGEPQEILKSLKQEQFFGILDNEGYCITSFKISENGELLQYSPNPKNSNGYQTLNKIPEDSAYNFEFVDYGTNITHSALLFVGENHGNYEIHTNLKSATMQLFKKEEKASTKPNPPAEGSQTVGLFKRLLNFGKNKESNKSKDLEHFTREDEPANELKGLKEGDIFAVEKDGGQTFLKVELGDDNELQIVRIQPDGKDKFKDTKRQIVKNQINVGDTDNPKFTIKIEHTESGLNLTFTKQNGYTLQKLTLKGQELPKNEGKAESGQGEAVAAEAQKQSESWFGGLFNQKLTPKEEKLRNEIESITNQIDELFNKNVLTKASLKEKNIDLKRVNEGFISLLANRNLPKSLNVLKPKFKDILDKLKNIPDDQISFENGKKFSIQTFNASNELKLADLGFEIKNDNLYCNDNKVDITKPYIGCKFSRKNNKLQISRTNAPGEDFYVKFEEVTTETPATLPTAFETKPESQAIEYDGIKVNYTISEIDGKKVYNCKYNNEEIRLEDDSVAPLTGTDKSIALINGVLDIGNIGNYTDSKNKEISFVFFKVIENKTIEIIYPLETKHKIEINSELEIETEKNEKGENRKFKLKNNNGELEISEIVVEPSKTENFEGLEIKYRATKEHEIVTSVTIIEITGTDSDQYSLPAGGLILTKPSFIRQEIFSQNLETNSDPLHGLGFIFINGRLTISRFAKESPSGKTFFYTTDEAKTITIDLSLGENITIISGKNHQKEDVDGQIYSLQNTKGVLSVENISAKKEQLENEKLNEVYSSNKLSAEQQPLSSNTPSISLVANNNEQSSYFTETDKQIGELGLDSSYTTDNFDDFDPVYENEFHSFEEEDPFTNNSEFGDFYKEIALDSSILDRDDDSLIENQTPSLETLLNPTNTEKALNNLENLIIREEGNVESTADETTKQKIGFINKLREILGDLKVDFNSSSLNNPNYSLQISEQNKPELNNLVQEINEKFKFIKDDQLLIGGFEETQHSDPFIKELVYIVGTIRNHATSSEYITLHAINKAQEIVNNTDALKAYATKIGAKNTEDAKQILENIINRKNWDSENTRNYVMALRGVDIKASELKKELITKGDEIILNGLTYRKLISYLAHDISKLTSQQGLSAEAVNEIYSKLISFNLNPKDIYSYVILSDKGDTSTKILGSDQSRDSDLLVNQIEKTEQAIGIIKEVLFPPSLAAVQLKTVVESENENTSEFLSGEDLDKAIEELNDLSGPSVK